MFGKHSNRRLGSIVILVLSVALLVDSILYFSERVKYSNEKEYLNEKLDYTNILLYQLQVESPLRFLLNYLGIRSAEEVDWEEQFVQEASSTFLELDRGISDIVASGISEIPDDIQVELQNLQGNMETILRSLQSDQPLDVEMKEEIMNFTQSIEACVQFANRQNWERFTSDIECLNKEVIK